jgi:hypothetical protein
MDAPESRLWTGAPERQIGGLATTRQLGCRERRLSSADPPKVVPLAQQPSFVRVGRHTDGAAPISVDKPTYGE